MEKTNNPNREREHIQFIIDQRIKAIYGRDEHQILSFYSPQVTTFDFAPPLQNNGIAAIKQRLENWLASYAGHISQEVSDVHIEVSGNMAYSYCLTRTYGTSIKGEETDMWYRTTTCYKKGTTGWQIVHEHMSDPVDFRTGKVMFSLEPEEAIL